MIEARQPGTSGEPSPAADDSPEDAPVAQESDTPPDLAPPAPGERGALLTALLFASGEVVPGDRLAEYLGLEPQALRILAEETAGELRLRGLDIINAASGFKLVTAAQWDEFLRRFHRHVRQVRLSKSALEILAVIAYEQPVVRTRIDELRQVNSESTLRTLLDRRLITVTGRAETPGRPFLYRTTDRFLEVFGLSSLDDLPPRPASLDLPQPTLGVEDEELPDLEGLPGFGIEELEEGPGAAE